MQALQLLKAQPALVDQASEDHDELRVPIVVFLVDLSSLVCQRIVQPPEVGALLHFAGHLPGMVHDLAIFSLQRRVERPLGHLLFGTRPFEIVRIEILLSVINRSSGFCVLLRSWGFHPQTPGHLSLWANSMIAKRQQTCRIAPNTVYRVQRLNPCHAIGEKRKMPGVRGQSPRR